MILSAEQLQAIQKGEAVVLTVDETECVLVRRDVFQKIQQGPYDDSDWTEGEMSALAEQMFDELDHPQKIQ